MQNLFHVLYPLCRSEELDTSRCQLSPRLLVSSASAESILVPETLLPSMLYHAIAVVNCRGHVVGAGNTCAICHIFARRCVTRKESVVRGLSPARLYSLPVKFAQFLLIECSIVLAKLTPRIYFSVVWYVQCIRGCAPSSHHLCLRFPCVQASSRGLFVGFYCVSYGGYCRRRR